MNKKITVELEIETLILAERWQWMRPSWKYWVNEALKMYFSALTQGANKIIDDITKGEK